MTNSNKVLIAEVPVKVGKAMVDGDFAIDGVPDTGAKIAMDWSDAVGGITGKLLPTGRARDTIEVDGVKFSVSIADAGNPVVFVNAASLNMKGTESAYEIEANKQLMELIEKIRGHAAVKCGLVDKPEDAKIKSPYVPFFYIVSPPSDYKTIGGATEKAEKIDLVVRALFMLRTHKAIQVSGSICTGAAARVPGSILSEVLREDAKRRSTINIGIARGAFNENSDRRQGKLSRIVARLEGPVTTPRNDAHYVVTEFGSANLKGLSSTERAHAQIALAHPEFGDELMAKQLHLV